MPWVSQDRDGEQLRLRVHASRRHVVARIPHRSGQRRAADGAQVGDRIAGHDPRSGPEDSGSAKKQMVIGPIFGWRKAES